MKLTTSDVKHIAKLSNLTLTSKETKRFQSELSEIISYVKQLEEVDTTNTQPTAQTTGLENVTRPDQINPSEILSPQNALSNTEKGKDNYFQVPIILDTNQ